MTDEELRAELAPLVEEIKTLVMGIPVGAPDFLVEDIERRLLDITHVAYYACQAITDEQSARNRRSRPTQPQPKLRPTIEDVL